MPAGGALFGSAVTGPGSTGGNKHLVEMRAGKMNLKGRMVYPDNRKGLLYVYQSEDSLMHFCWQDRTTGVVEDDLIIFPDDCEYIKVPQCATGRVYLLKFKSSNRKFFFWLQEPRNDKDDENCKRVNELLNNPSSAVQQTQGPDQDLQSLLNNMSQSQLMQLFGGAGQIGGLSSLLGTIRGPGGSARTTTPAITHRTTASTPTTNTVSSPSTPATPQNAPIPVTTPAAPRPARAFEPSPIQLAHLQDFLQRIAPVSGSQQQQQPTPQQSVKNSLVANNLADLTPDQRSEVKALKNELKERHRNVDLSTALTGEALTGILNNPDALQQLQQHLPPVDENTQEALRTTLASPQFQQAVSQFSSALESGQLGPVVSQLAVNPDAVAAAASGNMQEFVKALEKTNPSENTANAVEKDKENKSEKKDDKDDDEQMQLD